MHKRVNAGFSIIEVILASALFVIFASGVATVVIQGLGSTRLAEEQLLATQYASEGLEVAKSIRNQSYGNLVNSGGVGIGVSGGVWTFSGANNVYDKYTRSLAIESVQRDGSGNIVASGGTLDSSTKKVTSTVNWDFTPSRNNSVVLSTYLTNWEASMSKNGFLVYGNGGTTSDAINYKSYDAGSGTWGSAGSLADIDGSSANRALRAVQVYASATRNEKVVISRHYNGSTQYIYGQVFNGSSWGNVQLLASWATPNRLDVHNFSGTYLNNGDFMALYANDTSTPRMRIWNGSSWSSQSNLPVMTGIPVYMVARARPNTNEVMVAVFDDNRDTNTAYYNGSWTLHSIHASNAPIATKDLVDFIWSPLNTTKGVLVYTSTPSDRRINLRVWTANGSGGGSWSSPVFTPNLTTNIGSLIVTGSSTLGEVSACAKESGNRISCYKSSLSPSFTTPTNPTIATSTQNGIQTSMSAAYASISGSKALIAYSDNTVVPKVKKYDATTSTWDSSATSIATTPYTLGTVATSRALADPVSDDILLLFADTNRGLYSVFWNGGSNVVYSSPSGKAINRHSTNGSASTDYWYDFVWDNN